MRQIQQTLLMATVLAATLSCRGKSGKETLEVKSEQASGSTDVLQQAINESRQAPNIGVRNYDQIYQTFADLTGVPGDDKDYRAYFTKSVAGSLPTSGDMERFSGSNQVAIINLASFALDRSMALGTDESWNGGHCSGEDPRQAFNDEGRLALAQAIFSNFWHIDKEKVTADSTLYKDFSALADKLIDSAQAKAKVATGKLVVRGVCVGLATPAMSSSIVTTYGG